MSNQGCDLNTEEQKETIAEKLSKIGCLEEHYKVQDCFFEKKDWRKCKPEVDEFKKCMDTKQPKHFPK